MPEMVFESWNKIVDIQTLDCEALDVRKCEEATHIAAVEGLW